MASAADRLIDVMQKLADQLGVQAMSAMIDRLAARLANGAPARRQQQAPAGPPGPAASAQGQQQPTPFPAPGYFSRPLTAQQQQALKDRHLDQAPDHFGATTRLIGAAGGIVPGASSVAAGMRKVRGLSEAWDDFRQTFWGGQARAAGMTPAARPRTSRQLAVAKRNVRQQLARQGAPPTAAARRQHVQGNVARARAAKQARTGNPSVARQLAVTAARAQKMQQQRQAARQAAGRKQAARRRIESLLSKKVAAQKRARPKMNLPQRMALARQNVAAWKAARPTAGRKKTQLASGQLPLPMPDPRSGSAAPSRQPPSVSPGTSQEAETEELLRELLDGNKDVVKLLEKLVELAGKQAPQPSQAPQAAVQPPVQPFAPGGAATFGPSPTPPMLDPRAFGANP